MPSKRLRIYIAGAITGKPDLNRPTFEEARKQLTQLDGQIPNIVTTPHDIVPATVTHAEAMQITLCHILTKTDVIVVLPDSENSVGTEVEIAVGRVLDMPILDYQDVLREPDLLTIHL